MSSFGLVTGSNSQVHMLRKQIQFLPEAEGLRDLSSTCQPVKDGVETIGELVDKISQVDAQSSRFGRCNSLRKCTRRCNMITNSARLGFGHCHRSTGNTYVSLSPGLRTSPGCCRWISPDRLGNRGEGRGMDLDGTLTMRIGSFAKNRHSR